MSGLSIDDIIGAERIKERRIPLILLPTTSGTGSEITKFAILTDNETGQKTAIMSSRIIPDAAIVDPTLTTSMPANVTAVTGMDALSHAIECYLSPRASLFTETLALEAIRLIGDNLPKAFSKPDDLEARYFMSYASMLGGLLLNSTDGGGPIHGIGYSLGVHYHLSHGLSNTLTFVSVMDFVASSNIDKFSKIYEALGGREKGVKGKEKGAMVGSLIKDLIECTGLPKSLKEAGVKKEDLDMLTESAFKQQRLLKNSQRDFTLADIKTIFEASFEGIRISWQ
jgi:alcohol dehydrogenase class IV